MGICVKKQPARWPRRCMLYH